MPTIPNFPADLLREHMHWHHRHHISDPNRIPIGYGREFLEFHRDFIARALDWYRRSGYDPRLVEPWTNVPEPIRQSRCYDQGAEARLVFRPDTFRSADEFGRFLESSGIHGCIHQEAARLYGEPDLNDFDVAPRNTVFYNIHGMIDRWYRNWEGQGQFRQGEGHWCGKFWADEREVLHYRASDGSWRLGQPEARIGSGTGAREKGVLLDWGIVGDSRGYGPMDDGRPFRVWDTDGDGRLEVIFYDAAGRTWREGKLKGGKLEWEPVAIRRIGHASRPSEPSPPSEFSRPSEPPRSANANSRRKRNTRM
ncbi:hypothetical protein [Cohnella massiliensis]|uniref:hypothetical protein n=1 Tax=Cohnella massiliensis TaxID=1816691 RepID=UPI0009BB7CFF|nr:hypothetical protein [Cohnella massiliensis]